jgi:DNA-binding LytR/AlgR family response regulator
MKPPTAIIAEDEPPLRAELRHLLAQLWPDLQIVADCVDGGQAIDALQKHRPDVAFLDIRMPIADGLQVARSADTNTHIVFTTAFDHFAVRAFEDGAVDYLLKPVDRDRLRRTVERVASRIASGRVADVPALLAQLETRLQLRPDRIKWITASAGGSVRMISVDDVLFFQSDGKYTRVVTARDEAFIRMPIRDLLPKLDATLFWQIHRGTIVRVGAIRSARRDGDGKLYVALSDRSDTLPVSDSFSARFKSL